MRAYLDASVLVALVTRDALTARADAFLGALAPVLIASDFAAAEFASALARRVRTREIAADDARTAFSNFDMNDHKPSGNILAFSIRRGRMGDRPRRFGRAYCSGCAEDIPGSGE